MANILLLYDTTEKDIARDFQDLFEEFNIGSITMIPLSPNNGFTLEEKEKYHFDSANGAVFIITPGAERLGQIYPSPSVTHEMGQAKQKFKDKPESVIYLVDEKCKLPVVDQRAYINFNRGEIRSVLTALTQLIKELKTAGLFRTTPIPTQVAKEPKIDLQSLIKNLGGQKIDVLFDISNRLNGTISDDDLNTLLTQKYKLSIQDLNIWKQDLASFGLIVQNITTEPYYSNFWWLTMPGWQVVRSEIEKKKKLEQVGMSTLLGLFGQRGIK